MQDVIIGMAGAGGDGVEGGLPEDAEERGAERPFGAPPKCDDQHLGEGNREQHDVREPVEDPARVEHQLEGLRLSDADETDHAHREGRPHRPAGPDDGVSLA